MTDMDEAGTEAPTEPCETCLQSQDSFHVLADTNDKYELHLCATATPTTRNSRNTLVLAALQLLSYQPQHHTND
jgi:hypothetical protein